MRKIELSKPSLKDARMRYKRKIETINLKIDKDYQEIGKNKTYKVMTYGCQGNQADSEVISGILESIGYTYEDDQYKANVIIINTCAIRENAENRIWGILGNLKKTKQERKDMIIGICGCMPQEENVVDKILLKYPQIDFIFGTHNIHNVAKIINEVYQSNAKVIEVISNEDSILENTPKNRSSKFKAWVNIMYGCDEFCSYCIVPYTRGTERSRDKDKITDEVKQLVKDGYVEVTLLGQNVNAYGKDLNNGYTFAHLLKDINDTGIQRIRFTTSHPKDLDELSIKAFGELKALMPHFHLPVQSGSNDILKYMNRKYTVEDYIHKVKELKKIRPDISITTDIIVGFPNETRDDFEKTLKLVDEIKYDGAFTFIYSKREGTPAAKMDDNISIVEKESRLQELNRKIEYYSLLNNKKYIDKEVNVLIESISKNNENFLCGYDEHNKLVHIESNDISLIGKIVKVKITSVKTWFMFGKLC